nr:hypothetical protein [Tanacetum cinerariifolium]
SQGASLLWGSSRVSSGSGVEVVEWSVEWGRGGEWGWREKRLQVLQCLVFKRGRDDYCVGFGDFTQLVPRVIKD